MPAMNNKKIEQGDIEKVFENLAKEIGEVVDFQLPDWLNKWKPNYTIIRRNIYLTTQKVKRRVQVEDDGIFCSCSSTPGSSGICGVDCHCGMLLSSCSSNCKCDESCLNKPFHQRPIKKMKIVQTEKCGSGVVAEEDIMQGEFVIEYVGEVIDDKTCEERLWRMKRQGETNFYLCEINRDMVIDATYKGNKSRYINHSCSPNTEMQKWRIDGEMRIGIFATRDIETGEHITYDYQFMQFVADQDCHCGAVDCRRKLGVKLNKSNAALKIVACQVAINSSKVKAVLSGKDAYKNGVRQAAKFEDLAPPTQDFGEKIRKFLEIPPVNRTFQILPLTEVSGIRETEPIMSGSRKSSSHFTLHDIDCMLTEASYIKKEEPYTKPKVSLLNSKIPPPSKKRKDSDVIGSEAFPILLEFKEAMRHSQMGIEQMSRSYVEKLNEIEDLKKVAVGKTQYYENKLAEQAAQLEELKAKHSKEIEDIKGDHGRSMEDLLVNIKRDAGIAILDARIKMAEEASSEGFDKSSWDMDFWKKARANLTGEDTAVEEKDAEADKTGK